MKDFKLETRSLKAELMGFELDNSLRSCRRVPKGWFESRRISPRILWMEVQKGNHCAYQIHYHLVFPVKYRKGLLREEVVAVIKEVAAGLEERYGMEVERLGCDGNHIHLLCGAPPKYAPGQLVRLFKSVSGREIFAKVRGLKKELWGGEFWSGGYYVATVGERGDWKAVERYVRLQGGQAAENSYGCSLFSKVTNAIIY